MPLSSAARLMVSRLGGVQDVFVVSERLTGLKFAVDA